MKINQISIRDFKALKDVSFSPGFVNVFVGANGSGKSTLLEAIGVLSAAMTDRVDGNSLSRKGVRLSAPNLYKSAFKGSTRSQTISLGIQWNTEDEEMPFNYSVHLNVPAEDNAWRYHSEALFHGDNKVWGRSGRSIEDYDRYVSMMLTNQSDNLTRIRPAVEPFRDYAIYQPFTAALRGTVPDPQQAIPMGLGGGRLAEAFEEILRQEDGETFLGRDVSLEDVLDIIDWAEDVTVASPTKERVNSAVPVSRRVIEFRDCYLQDKMRFTAYDASEGALYVLFLYCLAIHPKAPLVFAVDNFDHAMHPRLAMEVMRRISELAVKQRKTIFLTTHNPLVLDGLDLSNDEIRLFTLNRSAQTGHVSVKRIKITSDLVQERQPLSRLWTSGRIGGVPSLI